MLDDNTLLFITLGAIVVLLIAYNISLTRVKKHIEVLDNAVLDTLALVTSVCQTMSSSLKEIRRMTQEEVAREGKQKKDIRG